MLTQSIDTIIEYHLISTEGPLITGLLGTESRPENKTTIETTGHLFTWLVFTCLRLVSGDFSSTSLAVH